MNTSGREQSEASRRVALHYHHRMSSRPCVGRWELVNRLGKGLWSTVYSGRPRDCAPDRPADYAIKIARYDDDAAQARQLLAREAMVGRSVAHPHLVTVLSSHLDLPTPMLVMPLMPGATLEQAIASHAPFSTPHALWLVRQVAEALAALHDAGWIHADVKPGNILVSPEGHATLIDLGFALQLDSAECSPTGTLRGSLTYTAPEMLSSAVSIDERCDTYSLGITLFELLTGEPPFTDTEPGPLMLAHMQRSVPNRRAAFPTVHRDVWELVQDMLAKEPLRRPTTENLVDRLVDLEIATIEERVQSSN